MNNVPFVILLTFGMFAALLTVILALVVFAQSLYHILRNTWFQFQGVISAVAVALNF